MALVLVLFVILASYIGPTMNFFDAWRGSKAEQAHLAALREQGIHLRKRAEELSGPNAAEHEARKRGMVDPSAGEAAFVVKGLH